MRSNKSKEPTKSTSKSCLDEPGIKQLLARVSAVEEQI